MKGLNRELVEPGADRPPRGQRRSAILAKKLHEQVIDLIQMLRSFERERIETFGLLEAGGICERDGSLGHHAMTPSDKLALSVESRL
jgi:hypothetical protein